MIQNTIWPKRFRVAVALPLLWTVLGGHAVGAPVMGMQIDSVQTLGQTTSVITTGTEFVFNRAQNSVTCYQRIPDWRQVATISGMSLSGLTVQSQSDQQCVLQVPNGSLTVGADGLLRMSFAAGANIGITGNYAPAYRAQQGNNLFLPDATGGVGMYLIGNGGCTVPGSWNAGWTVNYQAAAQSQLLVPVFPPRPFDEKQSLQTMLHSFSSNHPYPTDQELASWHNIGSVLTLHGWIWQGIDGSAYGIEKDQSWATTTFVPKSTSELQRVVTTAHSLGMKVIPYMSPCYFGNPAGGTGSSTMPQFLAKVQSVVSQYNFDGVYFDGLYNDIQGSYDVVRQTRQIIGDDGILYVHAPSPMSGWMSVVPCPFINTYATYILNGEHWTSLPDADARYVVSDYNLGNSIGTFCYDVDRPSSAMIDTLLSDNARLPYWVSDGTWNGTNYYLSDAEMSLMDTQYLPRINAMAPEPSMVVLLATGLIGLLAYAWRKRR